MNQAIIFDTNAYRNLTVNRSFDECKKIIDRIVTQEAINNNLSFLSPIVLIELAAHLNDTNELIQCRIDMEDNLDVNLTTRPSKVFA